LEHRFLKFVLLWITSQRKAGLKLNHTGWRAERKGRSARFGSRVFRAAKKKYSQRCKYLTRPSRESRSMNSASSSRTAASFRAECSCRNSEKRREVPKKRSSKRWKYGLAARAECPAATVEKEEAKHTTR
jgi:hypothetical protein